MLRNTFKVTEKLFIISSVHLQCYKAKSDMYLFLNNINYIINLRELCLFWGVIKYMYHNLISDIYKGNYRIGGEKTLIITSHK